ncbi:hypothetical protein NXZ75_18040 [Lysinibacillus sphaericus]|nr:hypothetical protein [Lysinibacillus sphaericus]MCS1384112.1 hypothetical protein [Lysinibacillus sphaericus]
MVILESSLIMKQGTLPILSHLNLPVVSVIILVINAMKRTHNMLRIDDSSLYGVNVLRFY